MAIIGSSFRTSFGDIRRCKKGFAAKKRCDSGTVFFYRHFLSYSIAAASVVALFSRHVAYETSGNIAVNDDEIIRFLSFVKGYIEMFEPDNKELKARYEAQSRFLVREKGNIPLSEILAMKGLIRRGEAKAACRFEGVSSKNVHFLNLPFYETGTIKKNPISQADIEIVKTLLQELKPHQIYVAGDLADPHVADALQRFGAYRQIFTR